MLAGLNALNIVCDVMQYYSKTSAISVVMHYHSKAPEMIKAVNPP